MILTTKIHLEMPKDLEIALCKWANKKGITNIKYTVIRAIWETIETENWFSDLEKKTQLYLINKCKVKRRL